MGVWQFQFTVRDFQVAEEAQSSVERYAEFLFGQSAPTSSGALFGTAESVRLI